MKEIKYLYTIYENFHHSMLLRIRIQSAKSKKFRIQIQNTGVFSSQIRILLWNKSPTLDPDLKHCAVKQVAHFSKNLVVF